MACETVTHFIPPLPGCDGVNMTNEETEDGHLLFHRVTHPIEDGFSHLIYLNQIRSYTPGFGTQCYRRLLKLSLDEKLDGRIVANVSLSSHLFHFKMGMKPIDKQIEALPFFLRLHIYARPASASAIFYAMMAKIETKQELSISEQNMLMIFKRVLAIREDRVDEQLAESISNETLIERREEVLNQTISSLWHEVLHPLLGMINKTPPAQRPCTARLGSIYSIMSEGGIARWRSDLSGEQPFAPFRALEHMHTSLFPWQVELLNQGLADARARGVKV